MKKYMVTSIPNENELYSLQRKIKKWYSQQKLTKETNYIYQNVINYFNLCQKYYLYENSLNNLIKLFYKSKQTFYNWAKKIQLCLKEKINFSFLAKKSTKPIKINNYYSKTYKIAVAKMMKKYRQEYGTGIYEFYNLTLAGFFTYKNKVIKHNIKTLMKWNKEFNNFYSKNKKIKIYKRYEMHELGHLQHDIKILTPNMTGLKRDVYLYDFIDEKSRFGLAYLSENKGQSSAIGIFNQAYNDFLNNKIKIKRIRTDNGPEYVYSYNSEYNYHKSEFTKALHQKGVIHQTTPIRSPQSNGKIKRFHQNWNKFFEYLPRYPKNINELRKLITIFLNYYNNVRRHKSINFLTPTYATKQVKVIRKLKTRLYSTITDLYIDDAKWNNYTTLQREEILQLNFIPIEIIPNNFNFEPSARYGKQFASILDIIAEKIMLDPLLNSGKFTINTNGVTGVVDQEISKMLASFIENDLLLVEGDPDSNFQPVDYIAGNFKGEQLTKIYDWLLTNYYKINRHHVPAIAKGAQQTQAEVAGVNIQTNASYEQMIYIREIKLTEFIIKLIKYDNAILNSRTFNIKNIDELIVDVRLPVNATLNRQLKNNETIFVNKEKEELNNVS